MAYASPSWGDREAALEAARERRDGDAVGAALEAVGRAARGDENIMPSMLVAVAAYATVGEVFGVLSEVFGRYHPPEVI